MPDQYCGSQARLQLTVGNQIVGAGKVVVSRCKVIRYAGICRDSINERNETGVPLLCIAPVYGSITGLQHELHRDQFRIRRFIRFSL